MTPYGLLLAVLATVACLGFVAWRATQQLRLFVIRIEGGRIVRLKGRLPRRLLSDIADVAERQRCRDLWIVCRIEGGQAQVEVLGDRSGELGQILRNLVGEYPAARLRQAPRVGRS